MQRCGIPPLASDVKHYEHFPLPCKPGPRAWTCSPKWDVERHQREATVVWSFLCLEVLWGFMRFLHGFVRFYMVFKLCTKNQTTLKSRFSKILVLWILVRMPLQCRFQVRLNWCSYPQCYTQTVAMVMLHFSWGGQTKDVGTQCPEQTDFIFKWCKMREISRSRLCLQWRPSHQMASRS